MPTPEQVPLANLSWLKKYMPKASWVMRAVLNARSVIRIWPIASDAMNETRTYPKPLRVSLTTTHAGSFFVTTVSPEFS